MQPYTVPLHIVQDITVPAENAEEAGRKVVSAFRGVSLDGNVVSGSRLRSLDIADPVAGAADNSPAVEN